MLCIYKKRRGDPLSDALVYRAVKELMLLHKGTKHVEEKATLKDTFLLDCIGIITWPEDFHLNFHY